MTKKYHVASSTIISKMLGILTPGTLDFLARKIVNENAKKSEINIFFRGFSATGIGLRVI